jgi:hypothetical protein
VTSVESSQSVQVVTGALASALRAARAALRSSRRALPRAASGLRLGALLLLLALPTFAQGEAPLPQLGVDPKPRRGLFAETTLGLFTSLGGSQLFSNGQPYLGMVVGRDLGDLANVFLGLGIGASSSSCFDLAANGADCNAADSFGANYLEAGGSYGLALSPRLRLSGRAVAGLTQLAPGPVKDTVAKVVPDSLYGFHFGGGAGLDYDTRLDHFAVGVDVIGRFTIARRPDSGSFTLFTLALCPRIRYVF